MKEQERPNSNRGKRFAWIGAIFLSFIVAFEIALMISPFAFFFYAAFNPFLLALNQWSLTRWLTPFFSSLPRYTCPAQAKNISMPTTKNTDPKIRITVNASLGGTTM